MQVIDLTVWIVAGTGGISALTCAGCAFRLHDDIWHDRRKWAPHWGVASILLLIATIGIATLISSH